MGHIVTAAYVTLRVPNELGQEVLLGFYAGAPVPAGVNKEDLERHIRKGMVAEEGTPQAEMASPVGQPVQFDAAGMPVEPKPADKAKAKDAAKKAAEVQQPKDLAPAGNASRDDWAAYATSKGATQEETKPVDEGGLSRDDLRAKYGA